MRQWAASHPDLWEFIKFNLLSNCATLTSFFVMWLCTGWIFRSLDETPFQFFIFRYTTSESLMLCGFLSFLTATAAAQTVNFFVQKNLVFHSSAAFSSAVPKYVLLAVLLVVISAALPAYSQQLLMRTGISRSVAPFLANLINILVQVAVSFPLMKLWIMPER